MALQESETNLSRNEILNWINSILEVLIESINNNQISLSKIEQLGTGAIYCQILDLLYPGCLPLNKVNWKAKQEYEYLYNFKLLQTAFSKLNIDKPIEATLFYLIANQVEKLVKAKYQDNLEFISWFKKYFDENFKQGVVYEAKVRRNNQGDNQNIHRSLDFVFAENSGKWSFNAKKIFEKKTTPAQTTEQQENKKNQTDNEIDAKVQFELEFISAKSERNYWFQKLKEIENFIDKRQDQTIEQIKNGKKLWINNKGIHNILQQIPQTISLKTHGIDISLFNSFSKLQNSTDLLKIGQNLEKIVSTDLSINELISSNLTENPQNNEINELHKINEENKQILADLQQSLTEGDIQENKIEENANKEIIEKKNIPEINNNLLNCPPMEIEKRKEELMIVEETMNKQ